MTEKWGFGNSKEKPFDKTFVGENPEHANPVELLFGEYPHSRSDNNIYARYENGRIEGFNGHRLIHEIRLREYNYLKESYLSGNEVRKGGEGKIYINGYCCGKFFFRDVMEALLEARNLIVKIHGHPIQIWKKEERDKLVGRKVWWREEPAIITMFLDDACVVMEPDGIEKFKPTAYRDEIDDEEDQFRVKNTIHSPHIWWYRDNE